VGPDFDEVRSFAEELGRRLAAAHPDMITVEQRLEARQGRVYLDAMRNAFGATVAAPYSVRRRERAPFSMPLRWQEVKPSLDPAYFNLGNFERHLARPDPWQDFFKRRQRLGEALKALRTS
jgi:bifunctional non-homologous end joining protein LigD